MKIFEIGKIADKYIIKVFGKKIFSLVVNFKYKRFYKKRFKGLTKEEARYILETQFYRSLGYKLNLDNPQTFNEKIQWYKLNYRDPLMVKCADKVGVREYVKEKIGEQYLVPIIGVYDSVDDIDFENLPNKFVAKVNWGSGQNIIVTDKSKLDIAEAKVKLKNWMQPKNNHYYRFLEWVYKDIAPKIIIEEFIESTEDLIDYKFYCFNGKVKYLLVCGNRNTDKYFDFYDENLNFLPFTNGARNSGKPIVIPKEFEKMKSSAKILSEGFPHVRVDFYESPEGQPLLGEMTFYTGNGLDPFDPIEWDYKLGEKLDLKEEINSVIGKIYEDF